MAETLQYRLSGDKDAAREKIAIARQGTEVLKTLMSFNKLEQGGIQKRMADGSVIVINRCFGAMTVDIFSPPKGQEEVIDIPVIEKFPLPVLVYVGPNDDFSEYTREDLIRRTLHYWGVVPESNLGNLLDRRLLVLACPKRILTDQELVIIKAFLKGEKRVVLFCGTDAISANAILRQLESKLDFIPSPPSGLANLSGKLPDKTLVWWPADITGWLNVNQAYWSTALVKDWKGFGLLYNNVTALVLTFRILWDVTATEQIINWIGDYEYSVPLIYKHNSTWAVAFDLNTTIYPTGYIPYLYDGMTITALQSWMSANASHLPLYRYRPHDFVPAKTHFRYGKYVNYTDLLYRECSGTTFAYATGDNIIVAAFKPSWLTMPYEPADIDAAYTTRELAAWLVSGPLVYADNFEQGGFQAVQAVDPYWNLGVWWGIPSILQY